MVHTAAILAGGLGTRLRSVVSDRPKVMATVAGRPFLTHLLDQLVDAGIQKAILCTGYMADTIQKELGERYRNIELVYTVEGYPLGTGGALRNAEPHILEDNLLVLNGDSYCDCRIADFISAKETYGFRAGMVLARVENVARFGAVQINGKSLVDSFVEKGEQTGEGWINAGIYLLSTSVVREIPLGRAVSLEREIFPQLVASGLFAFKCVGSFIDIGIPEEYERAQQLFLDDKRGTA